MASTQNEHLNNSTILDDQVVSNLVQIDLVKEHMKTFKMAGLFWSFVETTVILNIWGGIKVKRQFNSARTM